MLIKHNKNIHDIKIMLINKYSYILNNCQHFMQLILLIIVYRL